LEIIKKVRKKFLCGKKLLCVFSINEKVFYKNNAGFICTACDIFILFTIITLLDAYKEMTILK